MSIAKLLGVDKAAEGRAADKAADDAKTIRDLEKKVRDLEGAHNDRGRQLENAKEQIADLKAQVEEHKQGNHARDWQLEQQRELARKMKQLAETFTQPVLAAQLADLSILAGPPGRGNVPVDRGPMSAEELDTLERAKMSEQFGR